MINVSIFQETFVILFFCFLHNFFGGVYIFLQAEHRFDVFDFLINFFLRSNQGWNRQSS